MRQNLSLQTVRSRPFRWSNLIQVKHRSCVELYAVIRFGAWEQRRLTYRPEVPQKNFQQSINNVYLVFFCNPAGRPRSVFHIFFFVLRFRHISQIRRCLFKNTINIVRNTPWKIKARNRIWICFLRTLWNFTFLGCTAKIWQLLVSMSTGYESIVFARLVQKCQQLQHNLLTMGNLHNISRCKCIIVLRCTWY